ncbi:hypothetical protein [Helicobacter rodentium]|uniref:hypothetical protein n=1 Tax=Helicobacter rodentium TaxID=59617 RepID=UPI002614737C|nr:hypothetical protein [Helicobacter rodentium]
MAEQKIVKKKRTLVKFGIQTSSYVEGEGACTDFKLLQVPIGFDKDGKQIMTDCFYCEWLGSYGALAIQQQAEGIIQPARVRMPYVKAVYDALQSKNVKIYKNGKDDEQHTFCLNSAADNYIESNKMLEFQVKRYEVK